MLTSLAQADAAPAGGAEIAEIVIATGGAAVATGALLALGLAHRSGRTQLLQRAADATSRLTGLPAWAALPTQIGSLSLICALFGMLWDISLHIDDGRDAGPLANPGHYFILFGLFGVFAAGFLACVLPRERPSASAIRITRDWYAPVGGIVLLSCSAFSLIGFPLDDVWHRLFGQDVTLWGPTHLMLIGGAGLALIGQAILLVEGRTAEPAASHSRAVGAVTGFLHRTRYAAMAGGLLIGLNTFMAEYDFGVPQFRLVFHPILIAFAAGVALTAARAYAGPRGALYAVAYFIVIRGVITLLVGPVLGETLPYFPLYIAEALLVEAAARRVGTDRAYVFGAIAGGLIGTVGFAVEYAYSQIGFPVAWTPGVIEQGALLVPLTGVAAGLTGAYVGTVLRAAREPNAVTVPAILPAGLGVAAIAAVVAFMLPTDHVRDVRASVALTEVDPAPERTVHAEVRIDPPSAARDADWVSATAWQGAGFHLDHLDEVRPGVYRTTEPLPVHGSWKALIRLHEGRSLVGLPVYLPRDTAIPAAEVPAPPQFTRVFISDKKILQREQKDGVAGGLWAVAYTVVGLIALALIGVLGWALTRLGVEVGGRRRRPGPSRSVEPAIGGVA